MKVGIKKPDKVELYKMETPEVTPKGIFDDMENGICGLVDGLEEQLGCGDTPTGISQILCNLFSSLGTSLGCEELDPGECNIDADCQPFQTCVDGLCTTPEGVCFDSEECTSPEVCQDLRCCLPNGKSCTETSECCDGLSCLSDIILSQSDEKVDDKLIINGKTCKPPLIM